MIEDCEKNEYFNILAQRTGYVANWNSRRGWEYEKDDIHVWQCHRGWVKAKKVKVHGQDHFRNHRYFAGVEEALTSPLDSMDMIDYHDIVKIVEKYRPYSVKMIQTEEMRVLEPVLNNIRFALRELRKNKKKGK